MPVSKHTQLTKAELDAGKSPKGGYTRERLAAWGVPWPPPKGWQQMLLSGVTVEQSEDQLKIQAIQTTASPINADYTCHELLKAVVLALINAGHARDIYHLPDVLAYFGAKLPDPSEIESNNAETQCEIF